MKIVHIVECWDGGIATYLNTLLKQQVTQDDIESITLLYDPLLSRRDFDRDFYECHNIRLIPYKSSRNPLKIPNVSRTIKQQLQELTPDIVHLHSTFPGVYGRLSFHGFKTVYCAHGWSFVQEKGWLRRKLYGFIERFLAKRSAAIINISKHEQTEAKKAGLAEACQNIPLQNGVEDITKPLPSINFTPNPEKLNFGYIGRLDYKKGYDILSCIFANSPPENTELYVMGAASRDELQISTGEHIHHLGWINHDKIDAHIQKLDAIIIPSRAEGFGLVAIETMRNARPVIVSDRGSLPELVQHSHNGFVFDLDNPQELSDILAGLNKEQLETMGQNARKTYKDNYTAKRMAESILSVYQRVLDRHIATNDDKYQPPVHAAAS